MSSNFIDSLAKGVAAEDSVYTWLIANYMYVQDMRYQVVTGYKGPRLRGLNGEIILPDFAVYSEGKGYAIDVKFKTSIYPINGKSYFTVDDYKFKDYLRCCEVLRLDGLKIIFLYNNSMYMYNADEHDGTFAFQGGSAFLFECRKANKIR